MPVSPEIGSNIEVAIRAFRNRGCRSIIKSFNRAAIGWKSQAFVGDSVGVSGGSGGS